MALISNNILSDEETRILKKKASDILSVCRRDILHDYPFIGSIALRMDMVPVRDVRVRTACTDGNSVYFDIAFLSSLSREEQTFVLAHEVWHAVLMHMVRRQTRDPELFNIATDKEVNNMLTQDGFKAPAMVLLPSEDEKNLCAEEIYEKLIKNMKKMQKNSMQNSSSSNSHGNSSGSSSSSKQNSTGSSSSSKDGKDSGELSGQFDKHIYDDSDDSQQPNRNGGSNSSNGNGSDDESVDGNGGQSYAKIVDKYGEVGLDSDFQPKVSKDFADKMRETIIAEAQRIAKTKGNLPAHIASLVKKITSSEVPWQELLAQFVTKCYNSGSRSWIPPNRRHVHNGIYLQSRQASKIKLCVGIDTSGSTCADRSKFLAEIYSLIKSFGMFDLTLVECDAEVGACKHYTQDDNLEVEIENEEYTMTGGGGTAMRPIYDYILDNQIECDAIVIMTDGFIDSIPENPIPSIPTMWIITKDGREDFCDWGQKVHLTHNDADYE